MGILMDGGNAVESGWADHICSLPYVDGLPDMDGSQIEDSSGGWPWSTLQWLAGADYAVWIDSELIY